jgi:ATP-dependent protease ClpP protease subunit
MCLAGEQRYACEHSTFMFHGVAFNGGGAIFDAKLTKERLDGLLADEARTASIITDRSELTSEKVSEFYREARTMSAAEAHAVGIVHSVREVVIPPGCPVATLVFNR